MTTQQNPEEQTFEEDAAELKFPKEFDNAQTDPLISAEVFMLLDHRRTQNEQKEDIEDLSVVFIKTLNYTQRISRFKNRETIRGIRNVFTGYNLHRFEVAQTAEEAKALIPSIESKVEDDDLDELLKELHSKRSYQ